VGNRYNNGGIAIVVITDVISNFEVSQESLTLVMLISVSSWMGWLSIPVIQRMDRCKMGRNGKH